MKKSLSLLSGLLLALTVHAQTSAPASGPLGSVAVKKPLDHTVYDSWESIGERKLSDNGRWIAYTVNVQEGDSKLFLKGPDTLICIPRGYDAVFTADGRFAVCKIKPLYADIRQARIKKKKPEDAPKDSMAIVKLEGHQVIRVARVKSFQVPKKAGDEVAYLLEPAQEVKKPGAAAQEAKKPGAAAQGGDGTLTGDAADDDTVTGDAADDDTPVTGDAADDEGGGGDKKSEGSDFYVRDLSTDSVKHWKGVGEYLCSKQGNLLGLALIGTKKDSAYKGYFCVWDGHQLDTIFQGGHDFKKLAMDEAGTQVVFLTDRDTAKNALQHFYQLWYFQTGKDSARMLLAKGSPGMTVGWTVSENGEIVFSKNGSRLLIGAAPVMPPKDTTLAESEEAKLDIWNYKDDYLQSVQLFERDKELKRTYLGVYDVAHQNYVQLGSPKIPIVSVSAEGDGSMFLGITDVGKRIEGQWTGKTLKDIYAIDPSTGQQTLVRSNLDGFASVSAGGFYLLWYDMKMRQYYSYTPGLGVKAISTGARTKWYDEENDVPDDPGPYGSAGWLKGDSRVWVYDRYDIWALDPTGVVKPECLTSGKGRRTRTVYRYLHLSEDVKYIDPKEITWLSSFNDSTKVSGLATLSKAGPVTVIQGPYYLDRLIKAQGASMYAFNRQTYEESPNIWLGASPGTSTQITFINPQQGAYNWGHAQLVHWTTFAGKKTDGILYLPEDFDPHKKYPMITYFYEKLSDGLYDYVPPVPTPSRLNISFFVSRGYLVFTPDIRYTVGHPGKSAYDYIVSGVKYLCTKPYVDASRLGIQGQSWGGYQVAYLVTATHMFKAAWAGAPVVNMFSAYGGIRWESGLNRQFQYEHTQSRIGATPWQRPDLYIENSPLFHLPNVTTPLVIMSNDADGAVPWYQGIEMFTDMRRLGKQVWMLTYNGEAHNLRERRNQKDIQIREQQFFDWQLKGAKPARWLTEGVPATAKGREWGLELDGQ
jgi:dipeptidyl aminopeptidase/acylaminoacyl peptidase